ncbi:uncharacterized protein LOC132378916 [Hypanus sabinus]|uniref:uncharacterized protein LOC132378916 n=1 Tax=Hypanus sabinus TaxID=79690 RepID=UPI0028C47C58|nr:uncharacterized protein LOC132378916 [Hypanus sabinus]XP_059802214.1 uncharacterized protein LOC132378916 [Hypanus sabinus]
MKGEGSTELKVLYMNALSIRNKVDELEAQLEIGKYNVVGITETRLQADRAWEMNIQGYTSYRKDRLTGKRGGVALLVRNDIQSLARGDIESGNVESVWLVLRNSKSRKTLMGVIYQPPNSSLDVGCKLSEELKLACCKGNDTVVLGDFNMQIDWENQNGTGPQEREFVECLRDGFLEQLVLEPTREKAILDLVLCNEPDLIRDLEVKEPLGGNDHNKIRFNLQFEKEKGKSDVAVLQLNKGNYGTMREELAKVQWNNTLAGKTVEQQWQVFLGIMQKVQDRFIPKRKKDPKGKKGQPWLTREVKGSIKIKETKYNIAKMSGKPEDWEAFKEQQKITKKAIRQEKMRY